MSYTIEKNASTIYGRDKNSTVFDIGAMITESLLNEGVSIQETANFISDNAFYDENLEMLSDEDIRHEVIDDFTYICLKYKDNICINIEKIGEAVGNIINNAPKNLIPVIINGFTRACFEQQKQDMGQIDIEEVGKGICGIIKNSPEESALMIINSFICACFEQQVKEFDEQINIEEMVEIINNITNDNPKIKENSEIMSGIAYDFAYNCFNWTDDIEKIIKGIDKLIDYNPNLSSAIIEGFVRARIDNEYNKTCDEHELAAKKTAKQISGLIACRPDLESQIFDSFAKVYFEEMEIYDEIMQNFNDEEIETKTKNTFKDFIEDISEIIVLKPGLESSFPRIFVQTFLEELEERVKEDDGIEKSEMKLKTIQAFVNKGACLITDYIGEKYPDKYDSLAEIKEQIHNSFRQDYSDWYKEYKKRNKGTTTITMSEVKNSRNIERNSKIENNSGLVDNNTNKKSVKRETIGTSLDAPNIPSFKKREIETIQGYLSEKVVEHKSDKKDLSELSKQTENYNKKSTQQQNNKKQDGSLLSGLITNTEKLSEIQSTPIASNSNNKGQNKGKE